MKGTTKLGSRRNFHAGLVPLALLAGGLAVNCSSSDNTNPLPQAGASPAAGAAGANTAGTGAGGAGTAGAAGGNTAGANTGGAAACFPATYTRCSADACADLTSDPDYCGACTTKCDAAQVCVASKCSTSPTALVPAAAGCGSMRLVISGTTLYFSDMMHGTIKSVPVAGGTPTTIVMGETAPTFLKVNGTTVYWVAGKTIRKATIGANATASTVTTSLDAITGFTLGEANASIFFSAGKKIYKVAANAANATGTAVGEEATGVPGALAYDDASKKLAVPTEVNYDVDIMTLDGTPTPVCAGENDGVPSVKCQRVARSQGSVDDENVYIINNVVYWVGGSSVRSNSLTDANATNETVASSNDGSVESYSINGTNVYFTDTTGFVYAGPITGGDTDTKKVKLARGQMGVFSIVGDGTKAYWAASDCSIQQVALPTSGVSPT